ncbi:MAG TPA: hypothetical protein VHL34_10985 [Rhizomicrobium sp.]|jgi:hypothetical protein|nr:hypothetical protein [Rhizomicrobium sp.]
MKSVSAQNIFFDDDATKVMGTAFDRACKSIPNFSGTERMRVFFAKRILEAARHGERDPHHLHLQALNGGTIKSVRAPIAGVVRDVPVPAYARVPLTA